MALEILRPNGAGDYTNISAQEPDSGYHWDKVDEVTPDGFGTCVQMHAVAQEKDAYNLQATEIQAGSVINSVKVYFCVYQDSGRWYQPFLRLSSVETNGTETGGAQDEFVTRSEVLARPGGGSWSIADLNALQVCIGMRTAATGVWAHCTQIYVEVDYTVPYELSCSDGLKAADAPIGSLELDLSASDGLKPGDAPGIFKTLNLSVTDGLNSGDAPAGIGKFNKLATDGFEASDLPSVVGLYHMFLEDGLNLSDMAQWPNVIYWLLATDGLELSDTPLGKAILLVQTADGLKVGDSASARAIFQKDLQDGVKLGDLVNEQLTLNPVLSDGVKLSDVITMVGTLVKLLTYAKPAFKLRVYARDYCQIKVYTDDVR